MKSEFKTFSSEKDLNAFLRTGEVGEIIAIVPKMSHFVIFYLPKEVETKTLKTKKKGD